MKNIETLNQINLLELLQDLKTTGALNLLGINKFLKTPQTPETPKLLSSGAEALKILGMAGIIDNHSIKSADLLMLDMLETLDMPVTEEMNKLLKILVGLEKLKNQEVSEKLKTLKEPEATTILDMLKTPEMQEAIEVLTSLRSLKLLKNSQTQNRTKFLIELAGKDTQKIKEELLNAQNNINLLNKVDYLNITKKEIIDLYIPNFDLKNINEENIDLDIKKSHDISYINFQNKIEACRELLNSNIEFSGICPDVIEI